MQCRTKTFDIRHKHLDMLHPLNQIHATCVDIHLTSLNRSACLTSNVDVELNMNVILMWCAIGYLSNGVDGLNTNKRRIMLYLALKDVQENQEINPT